MDKTITAWLCVVKRKCETCRGSGVQRPRLLARRDGRSIDRELGSSPAGGLLLLFLGRPFSECCGVSRHRGADELFEGRFVDLLPLAKIDGTPRVTFQAGIEELLRVLEGSSASEGQLHDLLVGLPRTNDAVMRPDGNPPPFPLLLDVGVGSVDELTNLGESLSSPIPELFNPLRDARRSVPVIRTTCRLHAVSHPVFTGSITCMILNPPMLASAHRLDYSYGRGRTSPGLRNTPVGNHRGV